MNKRMKDILTVIVAVLAVGGFFFLAEGNRKDKDDNSRLAAINETTTTIEETTTTSTTFPTVSTQPAIIFSTTTTPTPTTVRTTVTTAKTTATTKKPTTGTTAKPATTTTTKPRPTLPHNGPGTEPSDNQPAFTLGGAASPAAELSNSATTDAFFFQIRVVPTGGNQVTLQAAIYNNSGRTISFPGGVKVSISITQNGVTQSFLLESPSDTSLQGGGYGISLSGAGRTVTGTGAFTASATVPADFGS